MLKPLTITDEYLAEIMKSNAEILAALAIIAKGQRELIDKLTEQSRKDNGVKRRG